MSTTDTRDKGVDILKQRHFLKSLRKNPDDLNGKENDKGYKESRQRIREVRGNRKWTSVPVSLVKLGPTVLPESYR